MQYVIYGAGEWGRLALDFLGHPRVKCFIDNYKSGTEYCGKEVISFDSFLSMDLEEIIVVLASEKYGKEMEMQIKEHDINRYFCFDKEHIGLWTQKLPHYYLNKQFELVSYNRILSLYDLTKYKRIAILGANELMPYLLSEIAFQNRIDCVCEIIKFDDNEYQTIGIPCSVWGGASRDFECLIINCPRCQMGLNEILEQVNKDVNMVNLYDVDCVEISFRHPELIKYKNIHKGKRIFVIGNGPSLKIEDLEKLYENHEICIASNNIYKIYNQTKWRADYIGMYDQNIIEDSIKDFEKIPGELFVGDSYHYERPERKIPGVQYYHCNHSDNIYYPNKPLFSEDFCLGFYEGYTVTYSFALQFAIYLGAEKIYLLGCDNNYTDDPTDESNHFIKNYYGNKKEKHRTFIPPLKETIKAFEAAKRYAQYGGVKIYNATRGGKLEVFERVEFELLF